MKCVILLVCLSTGVAATVRAQDADPIKKTLDEARSASNRKIEAAGAKLLKAMEAQIEKVAQKSNLEDLKDLEAQKAAFAERGQLPTNVLVAKAKVAYEDEVRNARNDLRKALETAKTAYTKARKISEAEAIAAELKDTAPKVYRKPVKEAPPPDKIAGQWIIAVGENNVDDKIRKLNVRFDNGGGTSLPGMFWRKTNNEFYTIVFPRGGTAKVRLGRGGEQFDGKMEDGKHVHGNRKV